MFAVPEKFSGHLQLKAAEQHDEGAKGGPRERIAFSLPARKGMVLEATVERMVARIDPNDPDSEVEQGLSITIEAGSEADYNSEGGVPSDGLIRIVDGSRNYPPADDAERKRLDHDVCQLALAGLGAYVLTTEATSNTAADFGDIFPNL